MGSKMVSNSCSAQNETRLVTSIKLFDARYNLYSSMRRLFLKLVTITLVGKRGGGTQKSWACAIASFQLDN